MKKILRYLLIICVIAAVGCDDYLEKEPYNILTSETVWENETLVEGVLANLYDRMPTSDFDQRMMQATDQAMWSAGGDGENRRNSIPTDWFDYYDYKYIWHINQFIGKASDSNLDNKEQFIAEGRFIRAFVYFELVKRMGGVPLLTKTYEYEGPEKIEELQIARSAEAEVYDFIYSELSEISSKLPVEKNPDRATKWAALALQARAMIYAGSLAKYNNQMGMPVTLEGGVVGIAAGKAEGYYEKALAAAKQIITEGGFSLESNYHSVFDKKNKTEMIYASDFKSPLKTHKFTYENSTPSAREDNQEGSRITPFLEMVECYEYLDGSDGVLVAENEDGTPVYYNQPEDIFANKDNRLAHTILYSNQVYRNSKVSLQLGQLVYNAETDSYDELIGDQGEVDAEGRLITGWDGPSTNLEYVSNSGFYMKKFVSSKPGAGQRSIGSENWWPIFRYADILLIASEAAMELDKPEALGYINQVRERAGFGANSLDEVTLEDIIHERKIEFAFEGHRYYDLIRWRKAEDVMNGENEFHALYGYLVVHPGSDNDGKYIYKKVPAPRLFGSSKKFDWHNYYSKMPQGALDKNPKLIKNPGH
ncbi:RagB/SusD family nutrient uptake outer membrane protein [Puteibacter caeruleilacunae]|nr:RagB/SusD family nutrient uptake outer membrane protein [Puteibacter caeruleilacunae]